MSNKDSILVYKEDVWNTADILRGVSITGSDFPKYMMPMFAILMIESRIVRKIREYEEEFGSREEAVKEYREEIKEAIENGVSYYGSNEILLDTGKTLFDICQNDQGFDSLLSQYLDAFDEETKDLLGITGGALNNLGFSAYLEALDKKKVKFQYVKAWSTIDLSHFNNSEITTLEEHIKGKWADISAATAGEHYTPYDIIELNTSLAYAFYKESGLKTSNLNLYDMTCGGGNMLFGIEDNFNTKLDEEGVSDSEKPYITTYGQEYEKSLYALAKIESRFRESSHIKYGNTLTNDMFAGVSMNVIGANPPYGVDWKQEHKTILDDETGRYHHYPSVGDGQLLFLQHAISKLTDDKGQLSVGFIVLNGSPLFSGDAGSGESEIRKWILENDYLEALIELPTGEFFNTMITTYIWVINKNKKASRKNKIRLVKTSSMGQKLKKSKGKKVNELSKTAIQEIVEMVMKDDIKDENVQDFHKDFFHYNKQQLELTETDINGKAFIPPMKNDKPQKVKLDVVDVILPEGDTLSVEDEELTGLKAKAKALNALYTANNEKIIVKTKDGEYSFNDERQTIVKTVDGVSTDLGCGVIKVKASYKKATAKADEHIATTVELTTKTEKDYEIIEYSSYANQNEELTQSFLGKWVERDYVMLDNKVGVEINFNKIFYKPEVLRPIDDIKSDLEESNAVLVGLMGDIFND